VRRIFPVVVRFNFAQRALPVDSGALAMTSRHITKTSTAGGAALSICESLLIALNDLNVFDDKETRAVLVDAAATHSHAAAIASPNSEEHLAIAALIQRIIDGKNSVRKF
jgi:hypothetical protein